MHETRTNKQIKIMIVGDHLVFRNGLKMLVDTQANFKVIGDVAELSEAALMVGTNRPDVMLVNSTEADKPEFTAFLAKEGKDISAVVLTNSQNPEKHQKYLLYGASGVVTKEQDANVLFKAVEQVNTDELWFKRDIMKKTIKHLIDEKNAEPSAVKTQKYSTLTDREKEVLEKICVGMKNKAIADALFITETTVRHHLTSIFEKLQVKSRLALAILAFNEGLVDVPAANHKEKYLPNLDG